MELQRFDQTVGFADQYLGESLRKKSLTRAWRSVKDSLSLPLDGPYPSSYLLLWETCFQSAVRNRVLLRDVNLRL